MALPMDFWQIGRKSCPVLFEHRRHRRAAEYSAISATATSAFIWICFRILFRFPPFRNDGFLYFSLVPNHPDARFWYFHSPLKINFCQSWIPQFPIRPLAPVHMFLFLFCEFLISLAENFHCLKMPNFNIFNSSQTQPALKINFHKSWIFHNFRFHQRHQCTMSPLSTRMLL